MLTTRIACAGYIKCCCNAVGPVSQKPTTKPMFGVSVCYTYSVYHLDLYLSQTEHDIRIGVTYIIVTINNKILVTSVWITDWKKFLQYSRH